MRIRLTNRIFYDVIILMIAFGIFIGILFPIFIVCMGIPSELVFNIRFFSWCIFSGIIVALMNIAIVKKIIIKRFHMLSQQMNEVERSLNLHIIKERVEYKPEMYLLEEDSDDVLGESTKAFNRLIVSLGTALQLESDVRTFTEMLSKNLGKVTLAENSLKLLIEHISAQGGLILLKESGQLSVLASCGIKASPDIVRNITVLRVMKENKLDIIELQEKDLWHDILEFDHLSKSVVIQPIVYKGESLGVIMLTKDSFSVADLNKLNVLAMSLSIAFSNAITHNQLKELSVKDPLTGLYNRRFGTIRLNEEYSRSIREGKPLGLIMWDIDYFKDINDSNGHLIGDKALMHVAKILSENIRAGDVLIRYGGDEFLGILPGADEDVSFEIAERARRKIMACKLDSFNESIQVIVSGGVASYPKTSCKSTDCLIDAADKALYEAKQSGRNRINGYRSE